MLKEDCICHALAANAEFQRELSRVRTGEGRKQAMAAGVKFGRESELSEYQRAEAIKRRANGETLAAVARTVWRGDQYDLAPIKQRGGTGAFRAEGAGIGGASRRLRLVVLLFRLGAKGRSNDCS